MPTTFSIRIGVVKMNNREMFDSSSVQLQDPQFAAGQEAVLSFIRKMNPGRVLAAFRRNAGLPDGGASPYGGWENALIGGHALGHWFSAAAMAVRAFGDEELREELIYIVRELRKCQAAVGNGFEYGHSFRGILREECLALPAGCSFEAFKEHPEVYIKKDETVSGLAFKLNGYRFRPYNEIVGERYGVYWYFG